MTSTLGDLGEKLPQSKSTIEAGDDASSASLGVSHPRIRALGDLSRALGFLLVDVVKKQIDPALGEPFIKDGPPAGTVGAGWTRARRRISEFTVSLADPIHPTESTNLLHVKFKKVGVMYDVIITPLTPADKFPEPLKQSILKALTSFAAQGDSNPEWRDRPSIKKVASDLRESLGEARSNIHGGVSRFSSNLGSRIRSINWQRTGRVVIIGGVLLGAVAGITGIVNHVRWGKDAEGRELRAVPITLAQITPKSEIESAFASPSVLANCLSGLRLRFISEDREIRSKGIYAFQKLAPYLGRADGVARGEFETSLEVVIYELSKGGDATLLSPLVAAKDVYFEEKHKVEAFRGRRNLEVVQRAFENGKEFVARFEEALPQLGKREFNTLSRLLGSNSAAEVSFALTFIDTVGRDLIKERYVVYAENMTGDTYAALLTEVLNEGLVGALPQARVASRKYILEIEAIQKELKAEDARNAVLEEKKRKAELDAILDRVTEIAVRGTREELQSKIETVGGQPFIRIDALLKSPRESDRAGAMVTLNALLPRILYLEPVQIEIGDGGTQIGIADYLISLAMERLDDVKSNPELEKPLNALLDTSLVAVMQRSDGSSWPQASDREVLRVARYNKGVYERTLEEGVRLAELGNRRKQIVALFEGLGNEPMFHLREMLLSSSPTSQSKAMGIIEKLGLALAGIEYNIADSKLEVISERIECPGAAALYYYSKLRVETPGATADTLARAKRYCKLTEAAVMKLLNQ